SWLLLQSKLRYAAEVARSEGKTEHPTLAARLEAATARLAHHEKSEAELKENLQSTYNQLLAESQSRSAAEQDAARVRGLEDRIHELEQRLIDLSTEKARLATALENERLQALEKMSLLQEARKELSDAFKALAGESLTANNENFLALARSE